MPYFAPLLRRRESLGQQGRSNQSILKEINPEYSLEGLMLKLQYFGHLMQRADSLEKTLMLGKTEGRRRRGWQRMRWLDGITDSMDMSLSKLRVIVMAREAYHAIVHMAAKSQTRFSDWTTRRTINIHEQSSTEGILGHTRVLQLHPTARDQDRLHWKAKKSSYTLSALPLPQVSPPPHGPQVLPVGNESQPDIPPSMVGHCGGPHSDLASWGSQRESVGFESGNLTVMEKVGGACNNQHWHLGSLSSYLPPPSSDPNQRCRSAWLGTSSEESSQLCLFPSTLILNPPTAER